MRALLKVFKFLALSVVLLAVVVACQDVRNSQGPELTRPAEDAIRIGTYNVHYIRADESEGRWALSGWEARKRPLSEAVDALDADVIAFQEMETFRGDNDDSENLTRSFLLAEHPEFAAAAVGDWRSFPSTQPIFYRTERFAVVDQGWFFFSDTPEVIYSRTFDGSYPAFASWATFRERLSGGVFHVVNIHTDYASSENRTKSIDLVAERVAPWIAAGETIFVAGDLNARLGSSLHATLEGVGLTFVPVRGATYHLDRGLNLFGAIDHIAYANAEEVGAPVVVRQKFGAVWPTDHYPLVSDFRLPE